MPDHSLCGAPKIFARCFTLCSTGSLTPAKDCVRNPGLAVLEKVASFSGSAWALCGVQFDAI